MLSFGYSRGIRVKLLYRISVQNLRSLVFWVGIHPFCYDSLLERMLIIFLQMLLFEGSKSCVTLKLKFKACLFKINHIL